MARGLWCMRRRLVVLAVFALCVFISGAGAEVPSYLSWVTYPNNGTGCSVLGLDRLSLNGHLVWRARGAVGREIFTLICPAP